MLKHTRDVAFIAGVVYFVQGAIGISGIALPLYLRGLSWSVSEITTVSSIAAFPWVLKILYGLLSDSFPIFGYRRKPYLFICSILSSVGWLALIVLPPEKQWIITSMVIANLGFAATDVITDGLVVEHSTPFTSSIYQSISWGSRSFGALVSGFIGGWLAAHWHPREVFMVTMMLPLTILVTTLWILERKIEKPPFQNVWTPVKRCASLIWTPNIRIFIMILILFSISSSFGTPFFFHLKEQLGFKETFLGLLSSLGWGGAMAGSFIYMKVFKKISPKKILQWAILFNSINIFGTLFIQDQKTAFIFVLVGGIMGCMAILPMMSSAAALTRQSGVEGTMFAVLMSIFNLGQICFGFLGGKLFEIIGLTPLIIATGVAALSGIIFARKLNFDSGIPAVKDLPMDFSDGAGALAFKIATKLKENSHTAFLAGGCVRDYLMGKTPEDFDIATTATPDQVEALFNKTIAVGKQFGVILVVEDGHTVEVATFRKEGGYHDGRHPTEVSYTVPEEDAKRRDFTVNGLFYDPFSHQIIDYVGGRGDLHNKVIRAIGDPYKRFEEDKLRLLRAVRFASSLGFEIEPETWTAVQDYAAKINQVSAERIRDEIVKMLTRPGAARGLTLLSDSGLLKEILPEIEVMKGVEQQPDYHPEGDVFIHTRLLLEKLQNPSVILALSALFHDVGKPVTHSVKDGKIKFYEHEHVGAKMTQDIMKRLRFSNDEIDRVSECVANHMKFGDVQKMRSGKLKRFVSRETFGEELKLHQIDCLSSHGKLDNYYFLQQKLKEYEKEDLKPKAFVNGHDLQSLGMEAGPGMKPFLEEIYELQLEGRFRNREEALAWAREKIKGRS